MIRSVLLEFPERESGETRLSVSVDYSNGTGPPTPSKARTEAIKALRRAMEAMERKEISDMGFRDDSKGMRRVQAWSVSE